MALFRTAETVAIPLLMDIPHGGETLSYFHTRVFPLPGDKKDNIFDRRRRNVCTLVTGLK